MFKTLVKYRIKGQSRLQEQLFNSADEAQDFVDGIRAHAEPAVGGGWTGRLLKQASVDWFVQQPVNQL